MKKDKEDTCDNCDHALDTAAEAMVLCVLKPKHPKKMVRFAKACKDHKIKK